MISEYLKERWRVTWCIYLKLEDWNWPTMSPEGMQTDYFQWIVQFGPFELIRWPEEKEEK